MISALLLVAAMVVPEMSEAELRKQADVVVIGKVAAQSVHRLGGRIFTFSTVVVGEGVQLKSYLVALPGGDLDGLSQRVPGSPQLVVGQTYQLYLGKADGPTTPGSTLKSRGIIGFYRGVFYVDGQRHRLRVDDTVRRELIPFGEDGMPRLKQ